MKVPSPTRVGLALLRANRAAELARERRWSYIGINDPPWRTSLTLAAITLLLAAQSALPVSLPLAADEAEEFLSTATVVDLERFDTKGVTLPRRAELRDGSRTARAVFKTIDEYEPRKRLADGEVVFQFRDSYKHEIAAWKLDQLLGLGLVPPCVERRIRHDEGSLCLWIEGTITEWERGQELHLEPPDAREWNDQMHTVRLFLQLIADQDYRNASNLLVDESFRIYKVDSSRAFRTDPELRDEHSLTRFSGTVLAALRGLDPDEVAAELKPWLSKGQIKGLLARRDRILELADARVTELGEDAVLYP